MSTEDCDISHVHWNQKDEKRPMYDQSERKQLAKQPKLPADLTFLSNFSRQGFFLFSRSLEPPAVFLWASTSRFNFSSTLAMAWCTNVVGAAEFLILCSRRICLFAYFTLSASFSDGGKLSNTASRTADHSAISLATTFTVDEPRDVDPFDGEVQGSSSSILEKGKQRLKIRTNHHHEKSGPISIRADRANHKLEMLHTKPGIRKWDRGIDTHKLVG